MKFFLNCTRLFAIFFLIFAASNACSEERELMVVVKETSAVSISNNGQRLVFYPSEVVRIVRREESRALVQRDDQQYPRCLHAENIRGAESGKAWMPLQNLADVSAFAPLSEWRGEKKFEVDTDSGDSGKYFRFNSDGTFSAESWASGSKKQKSNGRIFTYGSIVWARATSASQFDQWAVFWLTKDGSLCYIN